MRFLTGYALLLVGIAFVQSKPLNLQVNNLNALISSLPSLQNLNNQLSNVFAQATNVLSSDQLKSLQQQALQLAQQVFSGNVDVKIALNQLFQQLHQYLSANSQLLSSVQPLVQQLMNTFLTFVSNSGSNVRTRAATGGDIDLSAILSQFNNLDTIHALFPQYSDLVNQLVNVAYQIGSALPDSQLHLLEQQAFQLGQDVLNGNVQLNTAVNQLLEQLQQQLGSDSPIVSSLQPLAEQLLEAVQPLLPNFS